LRPGVRTCTVVVHPDRAEQGRNKQNETMRRLVVMLCAVQMLVLQENALAAVLRVPSEYPTIQAGIYSAVDGDTVLVADGTYTGEGNRDVDFNGKAILVTSENGPEAVIIDCQASQLDPHRGFHFHSAEGSSSVLRGFTITNGYAYRPPPEDFGGGAVFCDHAAPTIERNRMVENAAVGEEGLGGGIYCRGSVSPSIKHNTIAQNTANRGGAIFCRLDCSATIEGNVIVANAVDVYGGGIYCSSSSPTIVDNLIANNTAEYGGGLFCFMSSPEIVGNTITRNTVIEDGGLCARVSDPRSVAREVLCTSPGCINHVDSEGGTAPGEGNIEANPLFVSGPLWDWYLSQTVAGQPEESPCVDTGNPESVIPRGTTRTDGVWDVWRTDMGFHYASFLAVQVIPDTTHIPPGQDLRFAVDLINFTDSTLIFEAWADGYLLSGNPYAGNPVIGPVEFVVGSNYGVYGVRQRVHIPEVAPYGSPYRLCVRTGAHPGSIWAEGCFEFAIVPPPFE